MKLARQNAYGVAVYIDTDRTDACEIDARVKLMSGPLPETMAEAMESVFIESYDEIVCAETAEFDPNTHLDERPSQAVVEDGDDAAADLLSSTSAEIETDREKLTDREWFTRFATIFSSDRVIEYGGQPAVLVEYEFLSSGEFSSVREYGYEVDGVHRPESLEPFDKPLVTFTERRSA